MDFELLIIFSFLLFSLLIIGGVVLLFPLSRKVGMLLESRIEEKKGSGALRAEELRELASRLSSIEDQLRSIAERQEFLDRLVVEQRSPEGLPSGGEGSS